MQGNCGVVNSGVRATQGEVPHRYGKVLNRTAMARKRRVSCGDATERSGMVLSGTVAVWFRSAGCRNGKVGSGSVMARQGEVGQGRCIELYWNGYEKQGEDK